MNGNTARGSMLRATWLAFAFVAVGCGRVDPEAELAAARDSFAARRYSEAAIRLNNVVQAQPDNAEARKLRGDLALVTGDYPSAAAELDRARALGAPLDSIALGLADAWTVLGRSEEALALLDSVAETLSGESLVLDDPGRGAAPSRARGRGGTSARCG